MAVTEPVALSFLTEFLVKLFELEVPEIAEGTVKIMGVSRDPGFRAKIAVSSLKSIICVLLYALI